MSIFILDSINKLEHGNLSRPWYNHKDIYRNREMGAIRLIVRLIVGFECVQIIGFIFGVLYQPTDYVREQEFDSLDSKGGIAPEVSIEDTVSRLRNEQALQHQKNSLRI